MKAASLASHAHDPSEVRRQGLAFLAGVLAAFLTLAGLLLAAKAGGAAIGWGFQLQSPAVVGALALIMLLVALNLSGVFEASLPGQGAGGSLAAKGGLVGAFFTGALAVVVAAPCTAPFMATALGFALTQSAPAALLVFVGLGLGFAAPFVAVAFVPGCLVACRGLALGWIRCGIFWPFRCTARRPGCSGSLPCRPAPAPWPRSWPPLCSRAYALG